MIDLTNEAGVFAWINKAVEHDIMAGEWWHEDRATAARIAENERLRQAFEALMSKPTRTYCKSFLEQWLRAALEEPK